MRQRDWIVVAFCAGAFAGVTGLTWLMTRDKPGTKGRDGNTSESIIAAEPAVGSPSVTIMENGAERKGEVFICRSLRMQHDGSPVVYGVSMTGAFDQILISEGDAKAMLGTWEKYKAFKLPESNDRPSVVITWKARPLNTNTPIQVRFDVGTGKTFLGFSNLGWDLSKEIMAIQAAYKDIEALKKVPISAKPGVGAR